LKDLWHRIYLSSLEIPARSQGTSHRDIDISAYDVEQKVNNKRANPSTTKIKGKHKIEIKLVGSLVGEAEIVAAVAGRNLPGPELNQ
jgi:hypothetical protein